MRRVLSLLVLVGLSLTANVPVLRAQASASGSSEQRLVEAYDSLADTIIALEKSETKLVHAMLAEYHGNAQHALAEARVLATAGQDPAPQLEKAAEEIGKLATEGGREVQAIVLRLQKAGHHHNTAEGESFEYVLVSPEARKRFLELSKQAAQLAGAAKEGRAEAIQKLAGEVESELQKIK